MREELKDLLEAVETAIASGDWKVDGAYDPDAAIQRARNVLSQPEFKYLAFMDTPQRTWVGLTDEEFEECDAHETWRSMKNVEFKLKEKNT